jgi:hypothetical protein
VFVTAFIVGRLARRALLIRLVPCSRGFNVALLAGAVFGVRHPAPAAAPVGLAAAVEVNLGAQAAVAPLMLRLGQIHPST